MGDAAKGRVDQEICRRDLPITVGRKPRRFWSVRPLVTLPDAPGAWRAAQNVASLL